MWSGAVEVLGGISPIQVVERACPRPQYVTYEITGARAIGPITINTVPWGDCDSEISICSGRISRWTFNGPIFINDLTVDDFLIEFSGDLPRDDPFPIRSKISGQGLEFEWAGVMPQGTRDYASAVVDAVIGVWHKTDKAKKHRDLNLANDRPVNPTNRYPGLRGAAANPKPRK